MKVALLDGSGGVSLAERPLPSQPPGEALVRVSKAGICSTDLELARGYMGFRGVPGHEFVGVVERAPAGFESLEGARVVGEINASCGRCETCVAGLSRHCPTRTVLGILGRDGALAEFLALPPGNLHRVPDSLEDDRALFVEPVAAAFEVPEQIRVQGSRALVMGDGKLGALVAQVLAASGAEVTVLGRHEKKLEFLRASGIAATTDAGSIPPRSFPIVVEATGSEAGFEAALGYVRPRGTIILKTTCAGSRPLNLAPVVIDEVTVVGSRCGPFAPAIDALTRGRLAPEATIDARYSIEDVADAFARASEPGVRKVVVEM